MEDSTKPNSPTPDEMIAHRNNAIELISLGLPDERIIDNLMARGLDRATATTIVNDQRTPKKKAEPHNRDSELVSNRRLGRAIIVFVIVCTIAFILKVFVFAT
jgi:hypothetical protein